MTIINEKGMYNLGKIHRNLPPSKLVEISLARGEGFLASNGALCVYTGKYTGRSPNDKFVLDKPSIHDNINWGAVNVPFSEDKYEKLYNRMMGYLQKKDLFVFDGFVGAEKKYRIPVRIITELAWHSLFATQLFVRPTPEELAVHKPEFTVINAAGFEADPEIDGTRSEAFVILDVEKATIIIGAARYGGEIKKSIFTMMNYLMPLRDVMSMHCSANIGADGDSALFFGLSGTGKTTLSADPNRRLIGDDEHGWWDGGIFNYEGGCYAKCINLKQENEPQIYNSIKFGALIENAVVNPETRVIDYDDGSITENTRSAFPVDYIPGAVIPGVGGIPKTVVFLTADAFGVMPPVAKLTKEQAMYHFISGFTSKLAGTERGIIEPQVTFSSCFGSPFLPLRPSVYAEMLGEKITKFNSNIYMINTGWSGGAYGVGQRISIKHSRAIVTAALNGELEKVPMELDSNFGVFVPTACPGVPPEVLQPKNTWSDKQAYDESAKKLAKLFVNNFEKVAPGSPKEIVAAGPRS